MAKPLVVQGQYNDIPITIYGEIHNRIDQSFFQELDVGDDTVWVEHSTALSELLPGQDILFQKAKGLEWVWFTRTKEGKPVRCIDFRIEMGLMSRVEELELKDQLENIRSDAMMIDATRGLIHQLEIMLTVLEETEFMWEEHGMDVNPMKTRLSKRLNFMRRYSDLPPELKKSIPFDDIFEQYMNIYEDLRRMSSMLLDIVLIQELKECTDKTPIRLFVGLAHAVRLQHWLKLDVVEPVDPELEQHIADARSELVSYTTARSTGGRKRRKTKKRKQKI